MEKERVTPTDLYGTLGVPHTATIADIKRAFRIKAKSIHPDKGGDSKGYAELQKAYEILSDARLKAHYDRTGRPEKTAEEDFLENFYPKRAEPDTGSAQNTSTANNSLTFGERLVRPKDHSHSSGFEEWLRARDLSSSTIDDDYIRESMGVVKSAYQPVESGCAHPTSRLIRVDVPRSRAAKAETWEFLERTSQRLRRELQWGEVLVNVRYSAVTPRDVAALRLGGISALMMVPSDTSEAQDDSNAVMGSSGVGIVERVGPGIKGDLALQDLVIPLRQDLGFWQTAGIWRERDLLKLPSDLMPIEFAASVKEIFLAYHLLQTYANDLRPGDAIVLNGANSLVGRLLIQFAKLLGIRTLAVVRKHSEEHFAKVVDELYELGATRVFDAMTPIKIRLQKERVALPLIGFDCLLGQASHTLVHALPNEGGRLVCFGNLSSQPLTLPWHLIATKNVSIRTFNLSLWLEKASNQQKMLQGLKSISKLLSMEKLKIRFELFPPENYKEALKAFEEPSRTCTPLLAFPTISEEAVSYAQRQDLELESHQRLRETTEKLFSRQQTESDNRVSASDLEYLSLNPKSGNKRLSLIFLHHSGETPEELDFVFRRVANRDGNFTDTQIILPEGPFQHEAGGEELPAWTPETSHCFFGKTKDTKLKSQEVNALRGVEKSCSLVSRIAENKNITQDKLIVAGFHDGAFIALFTALTKLDEGVNAVVCIGLPELKESVVEFLRSRSRRNVSIFLLSGSNDGEVSPAEALANQKKLKAAGFEPVTLEHIPNGNHSISDEEAAHLSAVVSLIH